MIKGGGLINVNNIHPKIKEILHHRGISAEADILEFISNKPTLTYDPFLLKNMEAGVDLILSFIEQNKKICIYGDYDADGVTSTSLLLQVLSHLTDRLTYYIPSRFDEGYGLNKEALKTIREQGADLIITVDCGSVSYDEVEYGKSLGLEIIVTDHHNINDKPADCLLINPKQGDCTYPFKNLAGCGVAFKLAQGIQRKSDIPKAVLNEVLDLVAIATIGDIVPLVDENRTMTKYGLERLNKTKRPGLQMLIRRLGLEGKIKSEAVAYIIVPHLNAAGRMLDAKIGVELLTSTEEEALTASVEQLIENNKERKRVQEETFKQCIAIVEEEHQGDLFLIVDAREAHEGIAGIVAGKIKDEYGRPAILVTSSGEDRHLKGTGRSIESINLYEVLKAHEELFIKFGGHAGACGFLMEEGNLPELRRQLNRDIEAMYQADADLFLYEPPIDSVLSPKDLDMALATAVEVLEPFGCQNEKPLFLLNRVSPKGISYLGDKKQHVRFAAGGEEGDSVPCIFFQKAQDYKHVLEREQPVDLIGYADINLWNGNAKIQFVIKDIR